MARQRVFRGILSRVPFNALPRYQRNDSFLSPHATTSLGEARLSVQPFDSRGAWLFHQDGTVDSVEVPAASTTQSVGWNGPFQDAAVGSNQQGKTSRGSHCHVSRMRTVPQHPSFT